MHHFILFLLASIGLSISNHLHGMAIQRSESLQNIIIKKIITEHPDLLQEAKHLGVISCQLNTQAATTIISSIQRRLPLHTITADEIVTLDVKLHIDLLKGCAAWQKNQRAIFSPHHPRLEQLKALPWFTPSLYLERDLDLSADELRTILAQRARQMAIYFQHRGIGHSQRLLQPGQY